MADQKTLAAVTLDQVLEARDAAIALLAKKAQTEKEIKSSTNRLARLTTEYAEAEKNAIELRKHYDANNPQTKQEVAKSK